MKRKKTDRHPICGTNDPHVRETMENWIEEIREQEELLQEAFIALEEKRKREAGP